MDSKKKILLGDSDIISKSNEDLILNIELTKTYSELRNDKYDNVFDVLKQYKKERNSSRSFRIYGIIDSNVADCNGITLEVYESFTVTYHHAGIVSIPIVTLENLVKTITATQLPYGGYNIYGKKRAKYLIELDNYTHDSCFIKIGANDNLYDEQIFTQQLVSRDSDGNVVDYGTQTVEINDDGSAFNIDNDFYFFYNKHWIKKNLILTKKI